MYSYKSKQYTKIYHKRFKEAYPEFYKYFTATIKYLIYIFIFK